MDSVEIVDNGVKQVYTKPAHIAFVNDMKKIGAVVFHHEGRAHYVGPAAAPDNVVTQEDIIRGSRVTLSRDKKGRKTVFHPA